MDMWMRRRCQSCRLRRCREVGMKEECMYIAVHITCRFFRPDYLMSIIVLGLCHGKMPYNTNYYFMAMK